MRQSRAMFMLVLIASTVMCADAQALVVEHVRQAAATEPTRVAKHLAEKRQQTKATILTPRLVQTLRVTTELAVPADAEVPHWDVHPFRFRLPPPVGA